MSTVLTHLIYELIYEYLVHLWVPMQLTQQNLSTYNVNLYFDYMRWLQREVYVKDVLSEISLTRDAIRLSVSSMKASIQGESPGRGVAQTVSQLGLGQDILPASPGLYGAWVCVLLQKGLLTLLKTWPWKGGVTTHVRVSIKTTNQQSNIFGKANC